METSASTQCGDRINFKVVVVVVVLGIERAVTDPYPSAARQSADRRP
jgi:hypothetical protein